MRFLTNLLTVLSIPTASFLPAGIFCSSKNVDLKWNPEFKPTYKTLTLSNHNSNEQFHARGDGTRCCNFQTTDTSWDVACGVFADNITHSKKGYCFCMTGLKGYMAIDASVSSNQVYEMVEHQKTYSLRDINGKFSNKNDILNLFTARCHVREASDWYLEADNHYSEWADNRLGLSSKPGHGYALWWGENIWFDDCGSSKYEAEIQANYGRNVGNQTIQNILNGGWWESKPYNTPIRDEVFNNFDFTVNKFFGIDYDAALAGWQNCSMGFIFALNPDAWTVSANGTHIVDQKTKKMHYNIDLKIDPNGQNPFSFYLFGQQHGGKLGYHGNWSSFQRFDSLNNMGPTYNWRDSTRGNWAGTKAVSWSKNFQWDEDLPNPLIE